MSDIVTALLTSGFVIVIFGIGETIGFYKGMKTYERIMGGKHD